MNGHGLGVAGAQTAANRLGRYAVSGKQPSLVLDFTSAVYGADISASLQRYAAPSGNLPSLVFDFNLGEYGRQ